MLKIGIVDLDTSHPGRWVPILQEWQETVQVVACYDGGTVRPAGYAQQFAHEHNIPHVVSTLEEMVPLVDVAFVQTNDWDNHIANAAPFVAAGKGVFIDKPIGGNLRDLQQLQAWVNEGANIIGGSSLRCCDEVVELRAAMGDGAPLGIYATGPNDFFNYGIHTVEMVQGIVGGGAQAVTHLSDYQVERLRIDYPSGLQVFLELCSPARKFFVSLTATTGHWTATVQSDFYRALLKSIVAHFTGSAPFPASMETLGEAVKILLAGRASHRRGQTVYLDELSIDDPGFDGHTFNEEYRISRIGR